MAEIIVNPAIDGAPVEIVCGDANADVIRFTFDRYSEGIDLAGLAWSVTVKNAAGFSDVYMEGFGLSELEESEESISLKWELFGVATAAAGRETYMLQGLQGKALVKRFPVRAINVLSYLQSSLSDEAEADNTALRETIEYVGNQLPGILEAEAQRKAAEEERVEAETGRIAAEEERAAAEEGRVQAEQERVQAEQGRVEEFAQAQQERTEAFEQAQQERAEAFGQVSLTAVKVGTVTTVTAVNIGGSVTIAEVLDGKDGEGSGDMSKQLYDPDGDGVVENADHASEADHAANSDHAAKADHATSADHATEADRAADSDHATEADRAKNADNAVLYSAQELETAQQAQARRNIGVIEIPTPTAADSGKALMVDARGTYAIGVKPATATFLSATIPTAGWSAAAPYTVEIALSGMLASDTPLVDIAQTGAEETDAPIREAWTLITRIVPGDGSITVTAAEELPTVEIPIHMVVIR